MRQARTGFTLIELMIAISLLTLIMLYLYRSYSTLNLSNKNLKNETSSIISTQKLHKVIYLDFSLALYQSVKIQNRKKNEDSVFFQTSNSIHKRYNPYIAYIVKENRLYRLESLKEFKSYNLPMESEFDVEYLGEVNSFRVYRALNVKKESYLVHIDFKNFEDVLLKIKVLNEL